MTKTKVAIKCVHGMDSDSCSTCCDKDIKQVQMEVARVVRNFNWKTPLYTGKAEEEIEVDMDYDIEIEEVSE